MARYPTFPTRFINTSDEELRELYTTLETWSGLLTNELETEYGGSFENRLRFIIDVLTEIRKKVGKNFIVGILLLRFYIVQFRF